MDLNVKVSAPFAEKVWDDFLSPIAKPVAETLGKNLTNVTQKIFDALPVAWIYSFNCGKKVLEKLSNRINNIKEENLQIPDTHLFMKSIECLQYRDDKDLITQMFINLITNECDKTKAEKVHPALIEILNKMSKEEAMYLYKNKYRLFSNSGYVVINYESKDRENIINSMEYKILENLSSYGLLGTPMDIADEIVAEGQNHKSHFQFNKQNLVFLLLENIPDNLETK